MLRPLERKKERERESESERREEQGEENEEEGREEKQEEDAKEGADGGMGARGREKIPIETYETMHHLRSAVNRTRTEIERVRASGTET